MSRYLSTDARRALEEAREAVARNEDRTADEKALIAEVRKRITLDQEAALDREATRIVRDQRRPGASEPDGVITLFDPTPYEPNRLIRTEDGRVIENGLSLATHRVGPRRRRREQIRLMTAVADREDGIDDEHVRWSLEQAETGRTQRELTYDTFVHESGLWDSGEDSDEDSDETPT